MENPEENVVEAVEVERECFPLDEATVQLLADIKKAVEELPAKVQRQYQEQLLSLNSQRTGALTLFLRQHKLPGVWDVADNERELVKKVKP